MDGIIEGSGGFLTQDALCASALELVEKLGEGYEHRVMVEPHDLLFPGIGQLSFHLVLAEHLTFDEEPTGVTQVTYGYHFRTDQHPMLWRYDKHDDHPGVDECHVHQLTRWGHERVESCREVDIDDVVRIVQHDHMR